VVGALYLRSVPTSAGDIELITVLGVAGVLLGLVAGMLMKVQRTEDGSLVTVAGRSYATVWIATIAGRLLFAYGASDWFAPQIADFSRSLGITGSAAYTSAFVIMALAMIVTRVAVTAFRAVRATESTPRTGRWAVAGPRPRHTHLHHHAY
jgi:hypothetical protein